MPTPDEHIDECPAYPEIFALGFTKGNTDGLLDGRLQGYAKALGELSASIEGQHPGNCDCQPCQLVEALRVTVLARLSEMYRMNPPTPDE